MGFYCIFLSPKTKTKNSKKKAKVSKDDYLEAMEYHHGEEEGANVEYYDYDEYDHDEGYDNYD